MKYATEEQLIAFENKVKELWEAGDLPFLMHLAGGNEKALLNVFLYVKPGDWILCSHRSHYHYLLAGGTEQNLMARIKRGQSMFLFDRSLNFLSSSILAGTCCIAAGIAKALKDEGSKNSVWCFLGDGAEDEGHFYEAVRYVEGWDLPCVFVLEDNNRSVDVSTEARRGPNNADCVSFRHCAKVFHYCYTPTYPHAGSGCKHHINFKPISNPWTLDKS